MLNNNIRRLKFIAVLIVVCTVVALIYGLTRDPDAPPQQLSKRAVEVPSRPVSTVAANANNTNLVAPVKPEVTPTKAPLSPAQSRLVIAGEFHSAPDLKAFFDKYSSPAYAQNGAAAFYAAKAIATCGLFVNKRPEDVEKTLFGSADKNNPEAAIRINALRALGEECKGFTGKVSFADTPKLFKAAASLGDPNGLATTLLDIHQEGKSGEALELAKQLLSNPGSEMAQSFIAYFEFRDQPWTVGDGERIYPKPMTADAWRLVGCVWGDDCGPTSRSLKELCVTQGLCQYNSYDEYLRQSVYSPANYQALITMRESILAAVSKGDWRSLGLVPKPPIVIKK